VVQAGAENQQRQEPCRQRQVVAGAGRWQVEVVVVVRQVATSSRRGSRCRGSRGAGRQQVQVCRKERGRQVAGRQVQVEERQVVRQRCRAGGRQRCRQQNCGRMEEAGAVCAGTEAEARTECERQAGGRQGERQERRCRQQGG